MTNFGVNIALHYLGVAVQVFKGKLQKLLAVNMRTHLNFY